MRKFIKVFGVFAAIVALCACLTACSSPEAGKYKAVSINLYGEDTPIEQVFLSGESYIELKGGDKCVFCLNGASLEGTYKIEGDKITISISDAVDTAESDGSFKDGTIVIDLVGAPITYQKAK